MSGASRPGLSKYPRRGDLQHRTAGAGAGEYSVDSGRRHLFAQGFCALLRQRPDLPPLAGSGGEISNGAASDRDFGGFAAVASGACGRSGALSVGFTDGRGIIAGCEECACGSEPRAAHPGVAGRCGDGTSRRETLAGFPAKKPCARCECASSREGRADAGLLDDVLDAKRQALRSDGLIESVRRDASFSDVAGLKRLREWIAKRKSALTPEGQRFGLVPPKGILITGVQGCGKSLAARAVAGEWGFELARLDAGALYDKFVGESEKKLHKALELAQKLAPMVLWIDEIEKAFASAGSSGDADAGLSQRLLATLLTWMQDRESGVFLAATSNNITVLPPEMMRKGRFDEIFFVDLPSVEVRAALFELHLKKRGRDVTTFDLAKLAAGSEGFSGAEIEQLIVAGLYTAFAQKQQLTTEVLLAEIHATQPLSVTRAEEVESIRQWAKTRAAPAD